MLSFVTGKDEINVSDLKHFIRSHLQLKFLGLIHSDACYDEGFVNPQHPDYKSDLIVSDIVLHFRVRIKFERRLTKMDRKKSSYMIYLLAFCS